MRFPCRAAVFSALIALTAKGQPASVPLTFDLERLDLDPAALGSLLGGTGKSLPAGEIRRGLAPGAGGRARAAVRGAGWSRCQRDCPQPALHPAVRGLRPHAGRGARAPDTAHL